MSVTLPTSPDQNSGQRNKGGRQRASVSRPCLDLSTTTTNPTMPPPKGKQDHQNIMHGRKVLSISTAFRITRPQSGSLIVNFLEEWLVQPAPQNNVGRKHGKLKQIRGALRKKYPQRHVGSHFNFNTIRKAKDSRPEWDAWRAELSIERIEKRHKKRQV